MRTVAFTLYGNLARFGRSESFVEQVHSNLATMLLHLNDTDTDVQKVSFFCFLFFISKSIYFEFCNITSMSSVGQNWYRFFWLHSSLFEMGFFNYFIRFEAFYASLLRVGRSTSKDQQIQANCLFGVIASFVDECLFAGLCRVCSGGGAASGQQ